MKYLTDKYALLNKEGLGSESWLVLTKHKGYAPKLDTLEINGDDYHIHPFIRAKKTHAEVLGVEEGMLIAGVRLVDKGGSVHPEYMDEVKKAYDPSKGSWYVDDDGNVVPNIPTENEGGNEFFGSW